MAKHTQIKRTFRCPDCNGIFVSYALTPNEPPPSECYLCHRSMKTRKKRIIKKVRQEQQEFNPSTSVRRVASKSADAVYRAMESSSESRQEMAAEKLGVNKSSLSAMKITDMKDGLRAGDSSFKAPTPATDLMGAVTTLPTLGNGNQSFQSNGAEFAKAVGTGPMPFAGNRMREMITSGHASNASATVASGRKG